MVINGKQYMSYVLTCTAVSRPSGRSSWRVTTKLVAVGAPGENPKHTQVQAGVHAACMCASLQCAYVLMSACRLWRTVRLAPQLGAWARPLQDSHQHSPAVSAAIRMTVLTVHGTAAHAVHDMEGFLSYMDMCSTDHGKEKTRRKLLWLGMDPRYGSKCQTYRAAVRQPSQGKPPFQLPPPRCMAAVQQYTQRFGACSTKKGL